MLIVRYDGKKAFNLDTIYRLCIDKEGDKSIVEVGGDGYRATLGMYNTFDEAQFEFQKILNAYNRGDRVYYVGSQY